LLIALLALFFSLTGWGSAATVKNLVLGPTNRAAERPRASRCGRA
jgi:hypothetical protein